jgi:hypothetical protein
VNEYRVLASDPTTSLVAVEDGAGACHLGRALDIVPVPGATLRGDPPAFGVRQLRSADVGIPVPLVMVLTGCELAAAVRVAGGGFSG